MEELVTGPEFSVEALVHHGELVWSGVTGKITNEDTSQYFTEIGHTSPAELPLAEADALVAANAAILKACGSAAASRTRSSGCATGGRC